MANMKTQNIQYFIGLLLVSSLLACSGEKFLFNGKQDPLDGKDPVVNEGTTVPTTDQGTKPEDINGIQVDTVDFFTFELNKSAEFEIDGRVLVPGFIKSISIENLYEFPGAVFENGKFKWTPESSLFLGTEKVWRSELIVKVIGTAPDQAIRFKTKNVKIEVEKIPSPLIIKSIQAINPNQTVFELSPYNYYEVIVTDSNATEKKESWPSLDFEIPSQSSIYLSLSPFAKVVAIDSIAGTNDFKIKVNLELNQELTKSKDIYNLKMHALSPFGAQSASKDFKIEVFNKLSPLKTSWTNTVHAKQGQHLQYSFIYYNAKEEGYIQKPIFSGVPAGAMINCSGIGSGPNIPCDFEWNIPNEWSQEVVRLTSTVETFNFFKDETGKIKTNISHQLNVATTTTTTTTTTSTTTSTSVTTSTTLPRR